MDVKALLKDKQFLMALGVVGAIGAYALTRRSSSQPAVQGTIEGIANGAPSKTLYVPTSQYDVHINTGTQTTTNIDSSQKNIADTIHNPSNEPAKEPEPDKKASSTLIAGTKYVIAYPSAKAYKQKSKGASWKTYSKGAKVKVKNIGGGWWAGVVSVSGKYEQAYFAEDEIVEISTWEKIQQREKGKANTTTHTVKKGETLWSIADQYGDPSDFKKIASLNGISDPNKIYAGDVLKIQLGG